MRTLQTISIRFTPCVFRRLAVGGCISEDRHLHVRLCQAVPCIFRTQMSKQLSGKLGGSKGFRSFLPWNIKIFSKSFTKTMKNIFSFFRPPWQQCCLLNFFLACTVKSFPSSWFCHVRAIIKDVNSGVNEERTGNGSRELSCRASPEYPAQCAGNGQPQKGSCQSASYWSDGREFYCSVQAVDLFSTAICWVGGDGYSVVKYPMHCLKRAGRQLLLHLVRCGKPCHCLSKSPRTCFHKM